MITEEERGEIFHIGMLQSAVTILEDVRFCNEEINSECMEIADKARMLLIKALNNTNHLLSD